uniref:hypothetical protein n=1 Tax=Enterocloster aldenensis TaxID=358742 RepID=UPI0011C0D905
MEKLFNFLDDDIYRLMLDMSREKHSEEENQDIKERYRKVNQKKLFVVCREHELHGVAGAYAKSMGLPIPDEWEKAFLLEKKAAGFFEKDSNPGLSAYVGSRNTNGYPEKWRDYDGYDSRNY